MPHHPQRIGFIFEFKKAEEASKLDAEAIKALQQVDRNHYRARLQQQGIVEAIHVGLAFCGKMIGIKHEVYRYDKEGTQGLCT